jgi:hypothetical protein
MTAFHAFHATASLKFHHYLIVPTDDRAVVHYAFNSNGTILPIRYDGDRAVSIGDLIAMRKTMMPNRPRPGRSPQAKLVLSRRPRQAELPEVPTAQSSVASPLPTPSPAEEDPTEAAIRRMVEAAYT